MQRAITLLSAVLLMGAAATADAKSRTWTQVIDEGFVAHDKKMCRWDAPPAGGPACRITDITDQDFTGPTVSDRLNGWLGQHRITFNAVYYNGQLWSEAYEAFVIFVKTPEGWRLRYSSMGNGETGLSLGTGTAH